LAREDMVGRRYVDSEMAALELRDIQTDRLTLEVTTDSYRCG